MEQGALQTLDAPTPFDLGRRLLLQDLDLDGLATDDTQIVAAHTLSATWAG